MKIENYAQSKSFSSFLEADISSMFSTMAKMSEPSERFLNFVENKITERKLFSSFIEAEILKFSSTKVRQENLLSKSIQSCLARR